MLLSTINKYIIEKPKSSGVTIGKLGMRASLGDTHQGVTLKWKKNVAKEQTFFPFVTVSRYTNILNETFRLYI